MTKCFVGLSLAACFVVSVNAQPSTQSKYDMINELRNRVAELESDIRFMRRSNDSDWLTEQRADEIRSLISGVLSDADTRASLLQSGLTAGYDEKFFLGSTDSNFRLNIQGQLQFRFVYNNQDSSGVDDDRWGFENRRAKLKFSGHFLDPSWKYEVQVELARDSGTITLNDANIKKLLGDEWAVKIGQFKAPFMREQLVSSKRQLSVERSLLNEEFSQDRSQGIQLQYQGDNLAIKAMIHDGFGTDNTSALTRDTEFAVTARGEWLTAGNWKQFEDFTSWNDDEFGALFGLALHIEKDEFGSSEVEVETMSLTADASLEFGGANIFAALVYRMIESDEAADTDQFGFVVQGGVFFAPDEWEAFARFEYSDFDTVDVEDLNLVTIGVNRYWAKHNLKWTTDIGFALDEISSPYSSSGAGWRTDAADEDSQVVIRSQFQLFF